ncbi:MAG TPA: mechanosensitive ion channel domain-containing protein [Pseudomonadales bacterium]|nr:mechanosensitive ion channel domain-containing protein [Pseudomonadales bacterium]
MDTKAVGDLNTRLADAIQHLASYLFSRNTLTEVAIILALALAAWGISQRQRAYLASLSAQHADYRLLTRVWAVLRTVSFPLIWLIMQWLANLVADLVGWRQSIMVVTASLLTAWVIIRVASVFIGNRLLGMAVALTAWTVAALNILGWLHATVDILSGIGFTLGTAKITLLTLFKGAASLIVLLWTANFVGEFFESRIHKVEDLTPSIKVLFSKLFRITLLGIALLVAMSAVGIDLTAFAVVGGAVGLGIGFGLQKIVSNLVSGVILLLDDSIKPGDVIALGDQYGRVDSLGARYVSVTTRNGTEHLIPNEDLITNRVENWSHSNNLLRLRLGVGVHYKSDVKRAMALCLEAAHESPRVLDDPAPVCLMSGFGDNSVDLEVRYWINDPMNGRANVASDILVRIWDKFGANNIEIPYPQRDIHLRTPSWEEFRRDFPVKD